MGMPNVVTRALMFAGLGLGLGKLVQYATGAPGYVILLTVVITVVAGHLAVRRAELRDNRADRF